MKPVPSINTYSRFPSIFTTCWPSSPTEKVVVQPVIRFLLRIAALWAQGLTSTLNKGSRSFLKPRASTHVSDTEASKYPYRESTLWIEYIIIMRMHDCINYDSKQCYQHKIPTHHSSYCNQSQSVLHGPRHHYESCSISLEPSATHHLLCQNNLWNRSKNLALLLFPAAP